MRCDFNPKGCESCKRRNRHCQYEISPKGQRKGNTAPTKSLLHSPTKSNQRTNGAPKDDVGTFHSLSQARSPEIILYNTDTASELPLSGDGLGYPLFILSWNNAQTPDRRWSLTDEQIAFFKGHPGSARSIPLYIQLSPNNFDAISLVTTAANVDLCFTERSGRAAHKASSLALRLLRSYPEMILRRETLPPFIHRHGYSCHSDYGPFPPPLENAINIVSLLYSDQTGGKGTRKSAWKAIRMEVQKMFQQVGVYYLHHWQL